MNFYSCSPEKAKSLILATTEVDPNNTDGTTINS